MRFPLDIDPSLKLSLLFWITRYVKFKTNTLSSRNVKNQMIIQTAITALNSSPQSIEEISDIVKDIPKGGIEGVKSFFIPVPKLFLTSSTAGLSDATRAYTHIDNEKRRRATDILDNIIKG